MRISSFSFFVGVLTLLPMMLSTFAAGTAPVKPVTRVPLHWLWHEKETDSAYTISAERRETLIRDGYVDMGPIAYVEEQRVQNGRLLKCFYSPAPRTNTFCSISANEQRLILALGYKEVGDEGYIQYDRVAGSVVLYRVNRAYGVDSKDREHRFVLNRDELVRMQKQGWTYDGAKGFVYPFP